MSEAAISHEPAPRVYPEVIGDQQFNLVEERLDVFEDVQIWFDNPRITPVAAERAPESEEDVEDYLRRSPGYGGLKQSLRDVGQLEPIYAWRKDKDHTKKYLVLEGNSRVTILRELALGGDESAKYVRAKVLPPEFSKSQRAILLAMIHVRGSGVRGWGRYIQAKFIYEHVVGQNGRKPILSETDMARWMGRSASWVNRHKHAYTFALQFIDHVGSDDAEKKTVQYFSTLEEISKSTGFGPSLKDNESLRSEVFDMVVNDVFKEYRDARFMRQFHDNPEIWNDLKNHEKHAANRHAAELKAGGSSVSARIGGLENKIQRALAGDPDAVGEDELKELQKCILLVNAHVSNLNPFRVQFSEFGNALADAPLSSVKSISTDEVNHLQEGLEDFLARWKKHTGGVMQ